MDIVNVEIVAKQFSAISYELLGKLSSTIQ